MSDYYNDHNDKQDGDYRRDEYSYSISGSTGYADTNEEITPPKKHTGLKAAIAVLCLLIGIGGGYQIYRYMSAPEMVVHDISGTKENNTVQSNTLIQPTASSEETKPQEIEDIPSLFSIAARKDAKYLPDIIDEVMPSVVGVTSTFEYVRTYNTWGWGGIRTETETQNPVGTGTGIVMTENGYIITNAHVIYDDSDYRCGEAVDVSVLFSDESEHPAKIIAYDIETDLAVLKVDQTGLTPAEFGDSDDLRVGELVIAVGNPLGIQLYGSVTSGIVSALNRQIAINEREMILIQTDAAINAGNSGGPLLNSCGQVIGINSAKISSNYSSSSASVEGLGFAIPINNAKTIIDDLINYNHVVGRPKMGITSTNITEARSRYYGFPVGVYIQGIADGSAAEQAGLKIGDIIIGIAGEAITTSKEMNKVMNKYKAGDTITLTIERDGEDMDIEITLQDAADSQPATQIPDPFGIFENNLDEN